jgi:hypothetical protein
MQAPVEALQVSVLHRSSGLHIGPPDALFISPLVERQASELLSIVRADMPSQTTQASSDRPRDPLTCFSSLPRLSSGESTMQHQLSLATTCVSPHKSPEPKLKCAQGSVVTLAIANFLHSV